MRASIEQVHNCIARKHVEPLTIFCHSLGSPVKFIALGGQRDGQYLCIDTKGWISHTSPDSMCYILGKLCIEL